MSTENDITKKTKQESESSVSEPQPENAARAGRASDEGPDKQGRKKKEPDQLTTYDPAGSIPFSEWDGEEGPRP